MMRGRSERKEGREDERKMIIKFGKTPLFTFRFLKVTHKLFLSLSLIDFIYLFLVIGRDGRDLREGTVVCSEKEGRLVGCSEN